MLIALHFYSNNVEVDIDALTKTYLEGTDATQPDTVNSMIEYECNWLQSSGLSVKDISSLDDKQVEQTKSVSFSLNWSIEDVHEVASSKFHKSLSDEDAFEVLKFVEAEHNADIGINWDTLYCAIEILRSAQSNYRKSIVNLILKHLKFTSATIMFLTQATFKSFSLTVGLTTSFILIASSTKAISQDKPIVLETPNHLSVPVDIDPYLELIDDQRTELKTEQYLIRRRLASYSRIAPHRGSHQRLYTLYLDFFSLDGKQLLGTRLHNLPTTHP